VAAQPSPPAQSSSAWAVKADSVASINVVLLRPRLEILIIVLDFLDGFVERLVHGVQFVGFGGQPTASLHSMGLFVLFVSVFEAAHKVFM
jgi:hypothetical protein